MRFPSIRKRWLILVGVGCVLGIGAWLTATSRADSISVIDGFYQKVTPAGTGISDFRLSTGDWFHTKGNPLGSLSDLEIKHGPRFPQIDLLDPTTGGPTLTLMLDGDPSQRAIFDLPATVSYWVNHQPGFVAQVLLESNTIRGADLSPFTSGGTLTFSTEGITVDPMTNLATVSESATASFELRAVPEPATAVLAMLGGATGLVWLWRTRRRCAVPASLDV
jgi:hypothetical protein